VIWLFGRRLRRLEALNRDLQSRIKASEAKLASMQRLASLGEMASEIAHEINNPLAAIQFNLTGLQELSSSSHLNRESLAEAIKRVEVSVQRLNSIVASLKSLSREGCKDPYQTNSVQKIINETLEYCSAKMKRHGVDVRISSVSSDLTLICREVQISQVLLNLLNNAFDSVRGTPDPWISIDIGETPEKLIISVTDSGRGIPPDIKDKIMQPFFTTKPNGQGTGLGLSISREIIAAHKGTLHLDESSDHTRFVITIPRWTRHFPRAVA
jgi:C4-dicarboxylate-specific signal transduction histidine kinase